jgi:hypothetical protein
MAVDDIDFLRKVTHVRRQVRVVGNVPCSARREVAPAET